MELIKFLRDYKFKKVTENQIKAVQKQVDELFGGKIDPEDLAGKSMACA